MEMVSAGKSESEIVAHYRDIYGDRILIVPDGLTGRILFSLPVAISALACAVLFVCFRRMLRLGRREHTPDLSPSRPVLSAALREKIERELGDAM